MTPDQRRDAIVDAALAVALEKGLAATTVRDVAASMGTSSGLIHQFWLDAWAEAARRPALQATSRRLNLAWQGLLERTIEAGVASGAFRCADPSGAAWRILSLLDGLALQVVAHGTTVGRDDVTRWTIGAAEGEMGLAPGALAASD